MIYYSKNNRKSGFKDLVYIILNDFESLNIRSKVDNAV